MTKLINFWCVRILILKQNLRVFQKKLKEINESSQEIEFKEIKIFKQKTWLWLTIGLCIKLYVVFFYYSAIIIKLY